MTYHTCVTAVVVTSPNLQAEMLVQRTTMPFLVR